MYPCFKTFCFLLWLGDALCFMSNIFLEKFPFLSKRPQSLQSIWIYKVFKFQFLNLSLLSICICKVSRMDGQWILQTFFRLTRDFCSTTKYCNTKGATPIGANKLEMAHPLKHDIYQNENSTQYEILVMQRWLFLFFHPLRIGAYPGEPDLICIRCDLLEELWSHFYYNN